MSRHKHLTRNRHHRHQLPLQEPRNRGLQDLVHTYEQEPPAQESA